MSDEDSEFLWLEIMASSDQPLRVAVDRAELSMRQEFPEGGYTSVEMMERAWATLSDDERAAEMQWLFNAWWHQRAAFLESQRISDAEKDVTSLLEDGDLEVCEDYMSGRRMLQDLAGEEDDVEDAFVVMPMVQAFRLVDEIKLLRHCVAMLKVDK